MGVKGENVAVKSDVTRTRRPRILNVLFPYIKLGIYGNNISLEQLLRSLD